MGGRRFRGRNRWPVVSNLKMVVEPFPAAAWKETVIRGVDQHNVAVTGLSDYYPVAFFVIGANGEILGGILGDIWGQWMHIGKLWVSNALRREGYGRALMERAHRYALGKSCTHSFLTTNSYEARPFYEKLGYEIYGELPGHPVPPHIRYYLLRRLDLRSSRGDITTNQKIVMNPYPSKEAEDT